MNVYIILKDNLENIFLSDKVLKERKEIRINNREIIYEQFEGFFRIQIVGIVKLYYVPKNTTIKKYIDFIDVTDNEKFKLKNIINGSLIITNLIIEGADGTGKTTLVNHLAQKGYISQDRAIYKITQSMREEILKEQRIHNVKEYLEADKRRKVVFLYLSDEKVLEQRIFSRERISEYDKKAIIFQRLYLDTYSCLRRCSNLYIVDCLNKTLEQIEYEIIKLI